MNYCVSLVAKAVCLIAVISMSASCMRNKTTVDVSTRETLFTLPYGTFEDELYLFSVNDYTDIPPANIAMRDGIFYISNTPAKKIMQFTSYGDLIALYYNKDSNPIPSFIQEIGTNAVIDPLKKQDQDDIQTQSIATRSAISFPFLSPGHICVDSQKTLYAVDQVPEDRLTLDVDYQVLQKDVVHRFKSNGTYAGYLGQEGIGGTPFPAITGIYTNNHNELIVVSRLLNGYSVFWYASDGTLRYRIPISEKSLPVPLKTEGKIHPQMEKIIPSMNEEKLYIKVDYFADSVDIDTKSNTGLEYLHSSICIFDLTIESYLDSIPVPVYTDEEPQHTGRTLYGRLYEFMGITEKNDLYFYTPAKSGYAILIINADSLHIFKQLLTIHADENEYHSLVLSEHGIITALLATPVLAKIVWWQKGNLNE